MAFIDDRQQRLPHIIFTTPNFRAAALSSSDDGASTLTVDSVITSDTMNNASITAQGPGVVPEEETLLAMQELRMNTTHPFLTHTLRQEESSVLSLAADSRHIFSGSQGKDIYVRMTMTRRFCVCMQSCMVLTYHVFSSHSLCLRSGAAKQCK
jgi:hypothetical protein